MKKSRRPVKALTRPKNFAPYHQRFSSWWDLDAQSLPLKKGKRKRPRRLKKLSKTLKLNNSSDSDTSVDESMLNKLSSLVSDEDMTAELDAVLNSPKNVSSDRGTTST